MEHPVGALRADEGRIHDSPEELIYEHKEES